MGTVALRKDWRAGQLNYILKKIEENSTVLEDGSIGFSNFRFTLFDALASSAFDFPDDISSHDQQRLVQSALRQARRSSKFTENEVLKQVKKGLTELKEVKLEPFDVWTRVRFRIHTEKRLYRFEFDGISISLSNSLPSYMELSENQLNALRPLNDKDVPGYAYLIARGKFRNSGSAAEKLINSLEVFLSITNFVHRGWNFFGTEQRPECVVLMGPYQLLYKRKRRLDKRGDWYNPNFRLEHWRISSPDYNKIVKSFPTVRKAMKALESHPLREVLSNCLELMKEGMESAEMSRRTLRYWTALEQLFSNSDEKTSTDHIIKRAIFMEDDKKFNRILLKSISQIRNEYIHRGKSDNNHHQMCQSLAELVRSHFFYILFNGDDFEDHRAFLDMVDMPNDVNELTRMRIALERKERMLETSRHRTI